MASAPRGSRPKALFVVNSDWFFVSHRLALGRALRDAGFEVVVAAGPTGDGPAIEAEGLRFEPLPFDRGGRSPRNDARTLARLLALYRREAPDLVHHVTIKPVLYGSLAARLARVPAVVNAISGLGFVFIERATPSPRDALLRTGVIAAYRLALDTPRARAVFQNEDDRDFFVQNGLVARERTRVVRGSGVDTARFRPSPLPDGDPLVVLPARLLWDKGVGEFVEAARRLKAGGLKARFALVGAPDAGNPASVSEAQLEAWRSEGAVEWWGHRRDMPAVYASAHVVALPSYREGLPLALAEAAASGRACVTTDVPGCRDVVRGGETGWLVPARDPAALTRALAEALGAPHELARRGEAALRHIEAGFSLHAVVAAHLELYRELLGPRWPTPCPPRA
ncbi:MAG: glycosyltransferase family 4 protein [Polyangiaceae bacterium]|jgi:glycosyltransferase involved in cell wall biosynthesis|nr:glycosyltransferase family 4 protein [Polyangiaceae bacterium]